MNLLQGFFGICCFIALGYLFSTNRKAIDWKLVLYGVILQVIIGILVIKVPYINYVFQEIGKGFSILLGFTKEGAGFVFGGLATDKTDKHQLGVVVAFQILPTVIFFSTLTAGLYYLGVLQKIVYGIAWVMSKTMRLSGAESLSAAGNIFLGQTEAPLLVKPFIPKMTYSELMCLMAGGMATIAGGVMAAYILFLGGSDPAQQAIVAARLLGASMMNAPAAIVMAKMIIPQTQQDLITTKLELSQESLGINLIDALSIGAMDGLKLAMNIGGMLIAFIAFIAMINFLLNSFGAFIGINQVIFDSTEKIFKGLSLEYILGQIMRPIAYIMGVTWDQTLYLGSLVGQKTAINEFVAYLKLAELQKSGVLQEKTIIIATYTLCGFSNFGSIAIQIGGIGSMAPEQQQNLARLGLRALLAASLACMMTGTIAGALN
ncbi:MAG: NupC/NupG family nucleoside CNT transporter [Bacteroidetes bacterium]|nr:MAG: NupC/NupG family nucleoside CNT transporter [Bacteroidota bacterium]TAG85805.1 MAG: NupC/NupG family nucleoside CNT transporter [Bacteroidota bacterium]